ALERSPRPGFGLRGFGKCDQPARSRHCLGDTVGFPTILSATGVLARRQADITTVATYIDTGTDLAGAVTDIDVVVPTKNEMLPAARSDRPQRLRDRTALRNQLVERDFAVDFLSGIKIEIDDPHPADWAGRCADHRVGPLLPPRANLCLVLAR